MDQKTGSNVDEPMIKKEIQYIGTWEDLSGHYDFLKDNEFIQTGYRIGLNFWQATKSLFMLHNETVNIWTHLLGAIMSILMIFGVYYHTPIDIMTGEEIPSGGYLDFNHTGIMVIFIFAGFICQFISSMYHLYGCLSPDCVYYFQKLDYLSINILIIGTAIPSYYYFFFEGKKLWFYIYLSLILIIAVIITVVLVLPKFCTSNYRPLRSILYVIFGVSAGMPSIQILITTTISFKIWIKLTLPLILGGISYIIGAIIYGTRLPEKYYPGKFDYFFSSHQIFHVFVTLGVICHYIFLIALLDYRISTGFREII